MSGWRSSFFKKLKLVNMGPCFRRDDHYLSTLLDLREAIVERVARAAYGADRILLTTGIEQFTQPSDMHVHRTLIDIDVAAPDAVEQLLAAEHAAGMLQEKFKQAVLGRSKIHRAAGTGDAALLAIEFDVA